MIWGLLLFVAAKVELRQNNNLIFDLNYKLCKNNFLFKSKDQKRKQTSFSLFKANPFALDNVIFINYAFKMLLHVLVLGKIEHCDLSLSQVAKFHSLCFRLVCFHVNKSFVLCAVIPI